VSKRPQFQFEKFVDVAIHEFGETLVLDGEGVDEIDRLATVEDKRAKHLPSDAIVRLNPRYSQPTDVDVLLPDAGKARQSLGWTPKTTCAELAAATVGADDTSTKRNRMIEVAGPQANDSNK